MIPQEQSSAFDPAIPRILKETQPWARLMGIIGFVSVALMILGGLGAGVAGALTRNPQMAALLIVYPLMAALYVFPSMHLMRYANRIRDFVAQGQPAQLEAALDAQRAFWKFVGVLTLIGLLLGLAGIVLAVLVPLATVGLGR